MSARALRLALASLALGCAFLLVGGCDQGGPFGKARQAAPSEPNFKDFGNFEVHYNAVRSDMLTSGVARAYGIERSPNRVLLNVSLLTKMPDGRTRPADGKVTATAYNLNGQLKDLQMRRLTEGNSIYFIGEVGISGNEILVFDIDVTPTDQSARYQVQFKREFFAD